MAWVSPHSPETREAVLALLQDTRLSLTEIAARTGTPRGTVGNWSLRFGARRAETDPNRWSKTRRDAAARLLACPGADPRDVATLGGLKRRAARAAFAAAGLCAKRIDDAPAVGALKTALRRHIGRQIEALDAALAAHPAGIDSAKALRDLGGLTRLLDDIRDKAEATVRHGDADGEPDRAASVSALRESLARRYERFVRARGIDSVLAGPVAADVGAGGTRLVAPQPAGPAPAAR